MAEKNWGNWILVAVLIFGGIVMINFYIFEYVPLEQAKETQRQVELEREQKKRDWARTQLEWEELIRNAEYNSSYTILDPEKLELLPYSGNPKHAIFTMMGSDSYAHGYWMGAIALIQSLREVKTRVPNIVVMIRVGPSNVPKHAIEALERLGAKIEWVKDFQKPAFFDIPGTWDSAFTKLRVWSFTEYEKIFFMDSDTMIVNNVDHLLDLEELSAPYTPYACWCERDFLALGPDYYTISSGFFVCKPSKERFEQILDLISKPSPDPLDQDQFGGNWHWGDQEMLRVIFTQLEKSWNILDGHVYDTPVGFCSCDKTGFGISKSFHFACTDSLPKPFSYPLRDMWTCPKKCLQDIYLLWFKFLAKGFNDPSILRRVFSSMNAHTPEIE